MRKILYIITKSNFGGAQRYVYDLAASLPRDSYDVAVAFGGTGLSGASTGSLETKLVEAGIRTIRVRHFMRDMSFVEDARAFFELLSLIRAEKPDVLHVTSSKAGALGALAGRLLRVPVIVFTSHGLAFDESWRPKWQRALIWLGTWWTMLLATASIQISRDTYERARRMPFLKKKVHLVYNGIDAPQLLSRTEAREVLDAACGNDSTSAEGMRVGTIAELHPNKNLGTLIRAFADIAPRHPEASLWLMGEGEERGNLEHLAREEGVRERVHFTGYLEGAARVLPALDIFVLPSRKEGLPYVLLEAGLAGCAVIASAISGNDDIVENGISGSLIEGEPGPLAKTLTALLTTESLRKSYGAALRERVEKLFSIEHMREETCALYSSLSPSNPSISRTASSLRTGRS